MLLLNTLLKSRYRKVVPMRTLHLPSAISGCSYCGYRRFASEHECRMRLPGMLQKVLHRWPMAILFGICFLVSASGADNDTVLVRRDEPLQTIWLSPRKPPEAHGRG